MQLVDGHNHCLVNNFYWLALQITPESTWNRRVWIGFTFSSEERTRIQELIRSDQGDVQRTELDSAHQLAAVRWCWLSEKAGSVREASAESILTPSMNPLAIYIGLATSRTVSRKAYDFLLQNSLCKVCKFWQKILLKTGQFKALKSGERARPLRLINRYACQKIDYLLIG